MTGLDLDFWATVAALRTEHMTSAWLYMDAWLERPEGDDSDALFERLVITWIRLTPADRDVLLDAGLDLLAEPPLRTEGLLKWERLRRMCDGLDAATRPLEPS
jgi:hypothetical protein